MAESKDAVVVAEQSPASPPQQDKKWGGETNKLVLAEADVQVAGPTKLGTG